MEICVYPYVYCHGFISGVVGSIVPQIFICLFAVRPFFPLQVDLSLLAIKASRTSARVVPPDTVDLSIQQDRGRPSARYTQLVSRLQPNAVICSNIFLFRHVSGRGLLLEQTERSDFLSDSREINK